MVLIERCCSHFRMRSYVIRETQTAQHTDIMALLSSNVDQSAKLSQELDARQGEIQGYIADSERKTIEGLDEVRGTIAQSSSHSSAQRASLSQEIVSAREQTQDSIYKSNASLMYELDKTRGAIEYSMSQFSGEVSLGLNDFRLCLSELNNRAGVTCLRPTSTVSNTEIISLASQSSVNKHRSPLSTDVPRSQSLVLRFKSSQSIQHFYSLLYATSNKPIALYYCTLTVVQGNANQAYVCSTHG